MSGQILSEHESKLLLAEYGLPAGREELTLSADEAAAAAERIGFPVVVKLCGRAIAHKSERDLVRLGLGDAAAVRSAATDLLSRARPEDGEIGPEDGGVGVLVGEMISAKRELIAGMVRDPQFGPCVVIGLGGILTEALKDVAFAAAPLTHSDARALIGRLGASHLVTEPFRGEPAGDLDAIAEVLVGLGRLGAERDEIQSVDVNPLLLRDGKPVAVDALVELVEEGADRAPVVLAAPPDEAALRERFAPLFEPRGIVIAGVSSHPGKFGFVTFHNLMRFGYDGQIFPVTRDGGDILGYPTLGDVSEVPEGAADLVFVCTPYQANPELLKACRARGVRAAFIASGGYGEAGEEGRKRQQELVELADQLGMVVAGPNGQGVISTSRSMCAQIVAPFPPAGGISVASQSGNLVSSFLNYAVASGVGISKAISAGNSAQTGLPDYLEYYGADPDTRVVLGYLEGLPDGRRFADAARFVSERKPLVMVKGGVAAEGKRAAASHTGSLASDDGVFDGVAAQAGVIRAPSVEDAFEWAATFATQPLPKGRRTLVFTTAGGWGVIAADACAQHGLELIAIPDDLKAAIDELVPPRWSRSNPIDLAGGETRDTIPQVMDLMAANDGVDAIIHLGIGIQAAQAHAFSSGRFGEIEDIARIASFHQRQDRRYATAAREASEKYGKPILTATELVATDRAYGNSGPVGVKEEGRYCYSSANRAVAALGAMCRYIDWRARVGA